MLKISAIFFLVALIICSAIYKQDRPKTVNPQFIQNGNKCNLDYLTPAQLDSLKNAWYQ